MHRQCVQLKSSVLQHMSGAKHFESVSNQKVVPSIRSRKHSNHLNIVKFSLEIRQYALDGNSVFVTFTAVDTHEVGLMQFLMYYLAACEWLSSKFASGTILIVLFVQMM
jgi:hypothetical protein